MNYEIANKLKYAGFPQFSKFKGGQIPVDPKAEVGTIGWMLEYSENEYVYIPTLSDLIEACGTNNFTLSKGNRDIWFAFKYSTSPSGEGLTPEEAVANLWIALQTK